MKGLLLPLTGINERVLDGVHCFVVHHHPLRDEEIAFQRLPVHAFPALLGRVEASARTVGRRRKEGAEAAPP